MNTLASAVNRKTILPSGTVLIASRQESFTSIWLNRVKGINSLYYRTGLKQTSLATRTRASLQPVTQECEKVVTIHEDADDVSKIGDLTDYIKELLSSIDEYGRTSVSPYDTAWVALIKDINGQDIPQFPSSLEWIAQNQLQDGSWGDEHFFSIYDRLLTTLACVVALRSWNIHPEKSEKGIIFLEENICNLEYAEDEHMTCGFEVLFPALLERARHMGNICSLPYDDPVLAKIHAARNYKMTRIPKELMHRIQTTLLYSLEGLEDLKWEKLLRLQEYDGSCLLSPSSTAFAFMETKDENCLRYITNIVQRFNGGVPTAHPVDLFARIWAVDRLKRLGISHFFELEINECIKYVYRFWNETGIYCGGTSKFSDIDDTCMGFMILRLHGYNVNPDVLNNFKTDNGFTCFPGQTFESLSPIFNLYRASQFLFPGEIILEQANNFSRKFIQEKITNNQLLDKWFISKHFPDELTKGLEIPWYASLPRVEARFYIQNYGGANDVWIAKSLFRMPEISNDAYLELAKLDFNRCQTQHQIEWNNMQEWYENCKLQELGITTKDVLLVTYFLAAATIFEPERSKERSAWVKSQIISKIITSYFDRETTSSVEKSALLASLFDVNNTSDKQGRVINILKETLEEICQGIDIALCHQLGNAWGTWLTKLQEGVLNWGEDAELLVTTLNICGAHTQSVEILSHYEYNNLSKLVNKICHQLSQYQNEKVSEPDFFVNNSENVRIKYMEIEEDMQRLVQLVLEEPSGISTNIRQTFLLVAKSYYYTAYFSAETIDTHISKVLFEPIP